MGCREAIFVDKSTFDFAIFLLFFNAKFPIFPIFLFFLSNHAAGHPEHLKSKKILWKTPSYTTKEIEHEPEAE